MYIRSVFLGIVAASGIGQAAEAAIYRYGLTYEDTIFRDVTIYDKDDKATNYASIRASADPFGLPLIHPSLSAGTEYEFHLDHDVTGIRSCRLGPIDCTVPADGYWSDVELDPIFVYDELFYVKFDAMALGAAVDVFDVEHYPGFLVDGGDWNAWIVNRNAYFTVTSLVAPVPLPAGMLLLPSGLAALALIRRRRQG